MVIAPLLALAFAEPAPPPLPAPPPSFASYFSAEDYPPAAIRAGEEGTVTFRLVVSPEGRVSDCSILVSSGSERLDEVTCRVLRARARFRPARDAAGRAVRDATESRIIWRLPPEPPPLAPGVMPALPRPPVHARPLWTGPLFSNRDFPRDAAHAAIRGTVRYQFIINLQGRVSYCRIVQSSGWPRLDETVCRLLQQRARYAPGRDAYGNPQVDSDVDEVSFPIPGAAPAAG